MKLKSMLSPMLALVFILGCAAKEPTGVPPEEPEPLEEGALEEEMEVVIITADAEEPEEDISAEVKENLSWEAIKALGFQYEVVPGDTLSEIAARHNVGTGLLSRINNIQDPDLIRIGQKLTVIEGPFRVEVDKSDKILSLYLGEKFIRSYPVALGKKDSTPEGEFLVLRKLENPPWTDPYHRTIIRADNPDYPLGTRWIEFKPPPGAYGIHGTEEAGDIGREVSFGCVRVLHPREEEIYDFVILGSPVIITP